MSGRIPFNGASQKAQCSGAVKAPNSQRTTAEKRAVRYARKAREQARNQQHTAAFAANAEAIAQPCRAEAARLEETAMAEAEQASEKKAALSARAEEIAAPAREEASRLKEQAAKLPLPQLQGEGKYEARVVQALVEILTGRPSVAKPQKIMMPQTIYEQIALELSSTEQFYYRVTEQQGCTCKGWHFSVERYAVGYCRHYADAFPEQAAQNKVIIDRVKTERKAQTRPQIAKPKARAEEPRDLTPKELEDLKESITAALKGKYSMFRYVLGKAEGIQSLTIRYDYKDDYNAEEEAQIAGMIEAAQKIIPKGVEVYASSFL